MIKLTGDIKFPSLTTLKNKTTFENEFAKFIIFEKDKTQFIQVIDKMADKQDMNLACDTYGLNKIGYRFAKSLFETITKKYSNN